MLKVAQKLIRAKIMRNIEDHHCGYNCDEFSVLSKLNSAKPTPSQAVNCSQNYKSNSIRQALLLSFVLHFGFLAFGIYQNSSLSLNRAYLIETQIDWAKKLENLNSQNEKIVEILQFVISNQRDRQINSESQFHISNQPTPSPVTIQPEIGVITAAKANLRIEPKIDSPVLMVIGNSSKVVVEGSEGDWYRVTTPSGEKAYVAKSIVNLATDLG